jgi:hypothetical protein
VLLGALGVLDYRALADAAASETFLWPMIVGGLALGVGFIVSGYCPGTSYVAAASGKLDGLATVVGTVAGQLASLEHQPWLARFHGSGRLGRLFLYDLLGLPPPVGPAVVALAVTAMAAACFVGAEKLERALSRRAPAPASPAGRPGRLVVAGFGALAVLALVAAAVPTAAPAAAAAAPALAREELRRRAIEEPWKLQGVDLPADLLPQTAGGAPAMPRAAVAGTPAPRKKGRGGGCGE